MADGDQRAELRKFCAASAHEKKCSAQSAIQHPRSREKDLARRADGNAMEPSVRNPATPAAGEENTSRTAGCSSDIASKAGAVRSPGDRTIPARCAASSAAPDS